MRSRLLLNLALAVAALVLVAVVWLRPGKPAPETPVPLTALDATRIAQITLTPQRGAPFTLRREQGAWSLATPFAARARQYRVESLLGLLGTARHATLPAPPAGANPFGLAPPQARVRFDDTEIAFGDSNPVDYRRYVGTGGGIYLIDDAYFHHLGTTPADWVDLALLPPGARIEAIEAPDWRLARTSQGGYALTPAGAALSADALAQHADDWAHVQATDVTLADAPAADLPAVIVSYRVGEGAPVTVRFGIVRDAQAVRLLRAEPALAYALAPQEAERLLAPPQNPPDDAAARSEGAGSPAATPHTTDIPVPAARSGHRSVPPNDTAAQKKPEPARAAGATPR